MTLINYRVASTFDIKGIVSVYNDTHINTSNQLQKLNKDSTESFGKKGGHFLIFNEQEIMKILNDKVGEYYIAETDIGGKKYIKGFIYCIFSSKLYKDANYNIADSEYTEEDYFRFWEYVQENKVFIAYEIAVKPSSIQQGLSCGLMYGSFKRLKDRGYKKGLAEVQQIEGIIDRTGVYKDVFMKNEKSTHILRRIGSKKIGEKSLNYIKIGEKKVYIKSNIFAFDIDDAIDYLSRKR